MASSPMYKVELHKPLEHTIRSLTGQFDAIPDERKATLKELTQFIEAKAKRNQRIELIFICTHNSRRSHIAQLWSQAAAAYYGIDNVISYSGGTEATAFNLRAVKAMNEAGFTTRLAIPGDNPEYEVKYSDHAPGIIVFSKRYDSGSNPKKDFAAIMTCSHADENCPVVIGSEKRISLPYDDPKDFDGAPQEAEKYAERIRDIGREILFAFSQVSHTVSS